MPLPSTDDAVQRQIDNEQLARLVDTQRIINQGITAYLSGSAGSDLDQVEGQARARLDDDELIEG